MEKIFSKIGDVTIERRKSQQQPQTQPQPQAQLPQQQFPQQQQPYQQYQQHPQAIHQKFGNEPGNIPQQQNVGGFKNHPVRFEQQRRNPVIPTLNKNIPRLSTKNVGFQGPSAQGIHSDLIPGFSNMKPIGQPSVRLPQPSFPQQRISEPLKNLDHFQKLDNRFQLEDKVSKLGVKNVKPELLNKDINFGNSSKMINTPVRSQFPMKPELTQRKELKPDISKYTGISIERRKKVDVQPRPQEISRNPINIPGVNVQRIPAVKENPVNPELDEDNSDYEEDFEEHPSDEEDFDESGFIDPNYQSYGQFPTEKIIPNKPVQYPTSLDNTRQIPKPQPPVNVVKNVQPTPTPSPAKNLQVLDKFKQSGLTIERKKAEVKKPVENFNIPGIDIQRLGKVNPPAAVPLQVSSEDDDKQYEDFEGNEEEEEEENFDEYDENESEEYEEDPMMKPEAPKMPNIPNIPGVIFEKRKKPVVDFEKLAKQSGLSIERRKDLQESVVAKKPKPAFQNKSPIVLSSEDDERNEEELVEEAHAPQKKPEPILPPGISIQKRVSQPEKKPQEVKFQKNVEGSILANEENNEKEAAEETNNLPQKKPEPILPPGISIQKRTPQASLEKKAQEVKFPKDTEDMRFMSEEDDQMQDYPLDEEDEYEDEENPDEYETDQPEAESFQKSASLKPSDKSKMAMLNEHWEKFVERSGITIEEKWNKSSDMEFEGDDIENQMEDYDEMENEGEYDEMEDEAYNEDDNEELIDGQTDNVTDGTEAHEIKDEDKTDRLDDDKNEEAEEEKETGISDMVCEDLVELMKKGEIEGEIEDDKDDEEGKKDENKRKAEDTEGEGNEENNAKSKRKKKKKNSTDEEEDEEDDEEEDDDDEEEDDDEEGEETDKNIDKSKLTSSALRKNIREVMDETKLDESTLAAQRQEAERLKRLQEQQRIIRDVQKQIQMTKQNQKTQNKVLSLLQRNSQTSILKTSSLAPPTTSTQVKIPNHVLVKLSNGQQTSLNNKKMMELLKTTKTVPKPMPGVQPPIAKTLLKQGMVTPSVSIAPMIKKEPMQQQSQQQLSQEEQSMLDDKKKKKDVVTLSSDSEDDCIVLSEDEESEPEEDPTNSGMHTMDRYNAPDEQGRVIVNVGHPETEQDLYLAPQIARIIKPHQIGGIRFLYDNVIESIERFPTSSGFGCILAHSMGLGKTLQIVSFSDIFLRYTTAKKILVIMPINTIQNWLAEFNMWLPKENKTDQEVRCREFDLFIVNESVKNINSRSRVILDWHKKGGVLLMGYELFRLLSLKKSNKSKKKKKFDEEKEDDKNKELIEEVYGALVRPGPDLVICDEGHRIKNSHATTSQALKQIRTRRRIVLTGYPLQNNLLEYWCMVDFVRPNYLGSKTEFSNMFERPIQNGQCIDSTPQDKRLMRYRAHVLHSLLEGFVQRRSHAVLQNALPDKEEYVLLLRFTPFQRKLYDTFMNEVVRTVAVPNPLKAFAVCCKIWNHPDVLYDFLKKKGEEIDLDLEEALPPSMKPPGFPYGQQLTNPHPHFNQPVQPPQAQPWPKRGPGSRGGKVRTPGRPRVGRGGRKPAATIPPNSMSTNTDPEKGNSGNENFNAFQAPGNNFNQNQPDAMINEQSGENFPAGNFNQNSFGTSGYGSEYGNQTNVQPNANYPNKNPLDNLQDLSAGNFQNRKLFQPSNENGNQTNPQQNFDSAQPEQNFSQTMNNSNDSNLNASYDSNLNSSDSAYNQNDSTKSFDYNQEYSSEFYSGGENFQNSQNSQNFPHPENKPGFTEENNSNSNSYFQNSNFQGANANTNTNANANYDYQSGASGNFQNSAASSNFPSNLPNQNFQGTSTNSNAEFMSTDFQTPAQVAPPPPSNFQNPGSEYQGSSSNYSGYNQQGYWSGTTWVPCSNNSTGDNSFVPPSKYGYEGEVKTETKTMSGGTVYSKSDFGPNSDSSYRGFDDKKIPVKSKEEEDKKEDFKSPDLIVKKEDSLPYDWATDLFKNYVTGIIENSSKLEVFFHIVDNSIKINDRLLVFSQSLLTLDLIEDYLHRRNIPNKDEKWAKHKNYFRLDGSTPGLEREKLINEFNINPNIHIFLVSTRAGSLGINLVGANRVVVFDASWNPCHDTQAVCRVYRYGQQKQCYVYRLVMDSCLEKKMYDRQINKQGMADRVVDELNPDAHLSLKEVTNLCWDDQEDTVVKDFSHLKDKYNDEIIKILLDKCSKVLSKEPFQHESLLIDRKEKKLSQAEKRLAKRSYELEKQAANQPKNIYSFFPNAAGPRNFGKPIASVKPMQSEIGMVRSSALPNRTRWMSAEEWQKEGISAQEVTLQNDIQIAHEKSPIFLKAGQRIMILQWEKGIYVQLETGKVIAIRHAFKVGQNGPHPPPPQPPKPEETKKEIPMSIASALKNNPNVTISSKVSNSIRLGGQKQPFVKPFTKGPEKKIPVNLAAARPKQVTGKAKPFVLNRKFQTVTPEVKQRLMASRLNYDNTSVEDKSISGEQSGDDGKLLDERNDDGSIADKGINESPDEKLDDKLNASDSLETLRKVTERISADSKPDESDPKNVQMSSLKKYRHNFPSHVANKSQGSEDGKNPKDVSESETESEDVKGEESTSTQQGNENVQNWLMNQSYPPMDPYGNYFPGYYGYGPGPGPMMPPYDGFYPGNYGHPMGRNSPMVPPPIKQEDNSKTAPQPPQQPIPNPNVQNVQNQTAPRNSPVLANPPMYPPYPNPYPYPYNYPANPGFNNQRYPFPPNNTQTTAAPSSTATTTTTNAPGSAPAPAAAAGPAPASAPAPPPPPPNQNPPPYDNSMYNAFHRPDAPFQGPENPYPPPYPPRPPFPNSGTPGFFPYNAPYRPYPDPNYPYGNFNPYMHPPGYGYPMQNPPPVNNPSQNTPNSSNSNNNNNNSNQPNPAMDASSNSANNNSGNSS